MKIGRGMIFHAVCAISLLVAAAMLWFWIESFHDEFHHLSFVSGDARYTLRSRWGQLVWFGPPTENENEKSMAEIASRMSNDDFEWKPISPHYLEGTVKKNSATREMWDVNWRLRQWLDPGVRHLDEKVLKSRTRVFLTALEDPKKVVPAHFMLLCAAEERRQSYFHRNQQWRDASVTRDSPESQEEPILYMREDPAGTNPDLSNASILRQEWHDVLDAPRWAIFHGWFFLAALVMPFAWLTRPRKVRFTNDRWFFNWLALISAIAFLASAGTWIRSRWVDEQWSFATHPCSSPAKWNYQVNTYSSVGSSRGSLIWCAIDLPQYRSLVVAPSGWGYQKTVALGPTLPGNLAAAVSGEHKLSLPGLEFHVMPPQTITLSFPARYVPIGLPPNYPTPPKPLTMLVPASTSTTLLGFRILTIRWWLLCALTALAPAIWLWRAGVRWRRIRMNQQLSAMICLDCGYDMRATPQRCPECGHMPAALPHTTPIPQS